MHKIEIIHNPFIVQTQFIINGRPPGNGCKLTSYRESRLQVWVEKLFEELSRLFNGDNRYHVVFSGVEFDYLDVEQAAQAAMAEGMRIEMEWNSTMPAEQRLEQIRLLMETARTHPKFEAHIARDQEMQASFEEAFDTNFDVYVVATMSSGKSTFINAMLGYDVLPAANEATTATITRIADDKNSAGFRAWRIDKNGAEADYDEAADLPLITAWNKRDDTLRIEIEGNILAVQKRDNVRLVLTDTPGPNNSQDEEHSRVTMGFVQDSRRNPLILYVLNASQLGTNDDKNLLGLVAEAMRKGGKQSKDRFIFVVNKMDVFDPEKGEELPKVLANVRDYLIRNNIPNPQIYPVSANLARLIRKPNDLHSRKERGDYSAMADLFSAEASMNLLQYMPITSRVKRLLDERNYSKLMLSSGVPAVETMIDEYIDKYNLPHRVKRAYDAMSKAIEIGLNETSLISQLERGEGELAAINKELQALEKRRQQGFDAATYKDTLASEGKTLPQATEEALVALECENNAFIKQVQTELIGHVKRDLAEQKVDEAAQRLRFHFKALVNKYESVFEESQVAIKADLAKKYQLYVKALFADCENLQLPILKGMQQSIADIALNLQLEERNIKTRSVVISTRTVSTSKWYKPWSWGDEEVRNVYGEESYVDLRQVWLERETMVRTEFTNLVSSARLQIEDGKDKLVAQFLAFMEQEFDEKFSALIQSISNKLVDREAREAALAEAKSLQQWINTFKTELDQTLAI